jgi:hypothetical protein
MEHFVTYTANKRGLVGALQAVVASKSDLYADGRRRIVESIGRLLSAGVAVGEIRTDVDAENVLRAMN